MGAAAPSSAAEPEWTAAVTAASDYYFRGVSQTLNEPALQADLAVEHASGWFGSLFASTVSFPERPYENLGTIEIAAQVGYGHSLGRGWTAVGTAAHYAYPDAEIGHDYLELGVGSSRSAPRRRRKAAIRAPGSSSRPGRRSSPRYPGAATISSPAARWRRPRSQASPHSCWSIGGSPPIGWRRCFARRRMAPAPAARRRSSMLAQPSHASSRACAARRLIGRT